MRSWIYFLLFVFFLGCVGNSLDRRKYAFVDSLRMDSPGVSDVAGPERSRCIVREYNFLDTCRTKFVKELHIDTTRNGFLDKLKVIRLRDRELTSKIQAKALYFYREKKLKTEWLELDAPLEQFYVFAKQVKEAYTYGLNPRHYYIEDLQTEIERVYLNPVRSHDEVTDLDMRITGSFFLFTTHLIEGRIPADGNAQFIWLRDKPRENDIELLLSIKSEEQMRKQLQALHPVHPQYSKLKDALAKYRELARRYPHLPRLQFTRRIYPGKKDMLVPAVRRRLELTDPTNVPVTGDPLHYDDHLVSVVKQFQQRHGLLADGIIGPSTVKQLNVSFQAKVDLITLNLERLRWLPNDFPDDYITINLPEYKLQVFNRDECVLSMRVVAGSSFTSTPVFSDTLEYIVFSPTWTVPYSIIQREMIPRLRKDSLYYSNRNYIFYQHGVEINPSVVSWKQDRIDIQSYKVVQKPGPWNALGRVKFIMPNNMYIYLHDTPADRLFSRNDRALSHGCIRLEDPMGFARYLLRDDKEWDEKKITDAMRGPEPRRVDLKQPVHVQIEYRSVWVDDDGLVHFRPDIYGHDERQLRRLQDFITPADLVPERGPLVTSPKATISDSLRYDFFSASRTNHPQNGRLNLKTKS
jgi:murein L,D-transpeptidase YcbB/YkuD